MGHTVRYYTYLHVFQPYSPIASSRTCSFDLATQAATPLQGIKSHRLQPHLSGLTFCTTNPQTSHRSPTTPSQQYQQDSLLRNRPGNSWNVVGLVLKIVSFSVCGYLGSRRPSPVNFRGAISIGIGGERLSSSEPRLSARERPSVSTDERKTLSQLSQESGFEEDSACAMFCISFPEPAGFPAAVVPVVGGSPGPAPEPPPKKVNGLDESPGWRGKKSISERTAIGSSLMNPSSSASVASSVRRKADGDVGVMGEAEALMGVNSSFNRARRLLLLFERSVSPAVGLEGDIVPVAVCKLKTGGDAKRGKGTRRGWR